MFVLIVLSLIILHKYIPDMWYPRGGVVVVVGVIGDGEDGFEVQVGS